MKRIFQHVSSRFAVLALGAAVIVAGSAAAFSEKAPKTSFTAPPVDERPIARDAGSHASFAPVVKKVAPGVVKIFTTTKLHNASLNGNGLPEMDDFMRHFFGNQFPGQMPRRNFSVPRQEGIGSGVIVTKDGYILTNNHVVDGADEVKVALQDGREFTAKVIGRDPQSDVAVIKIDAKDLPAVPMVDSDKVEVGDIVLAIGNPFGIGQTVTTGIVSATGRAGALGLDYEDFIQTDAAINPGNSGGALVDAEGRLMGINTWIISSSGGSQGLGFAVPINLARYVMDRLTKEGKVRRAYLGLHLQPEMTPELARQFKLPNFNGALVTEVEPGSPGAKAGFRDGDFVIEFEGRKVRNMEQFRLMVSETAPGTKVTLKVLRDGAEKSMTATLGAMPDEVLARGGRTQPNDRGQSDMDSLDGVEVSDLDTQARRETEFPADLKGALVSNVDQDSNAAEAGLRQGDVILEIDRHAVHSADEAVNASEKAKGDHILLRVWRRDNAGGRGGTLYLSVDNVKRK